ncbi:MAG TPA: twin-arginine translocase TatA/TatE family subunit [Nitrososphaeraceae archaeon]|jgi:sec-independent protein translocase protein TatA|nr:twin-arginine translocase TatA/TatE family subunit [Nitrososphaeraceae archaeon]
MNVEMEILPLNMIMQMIPTGFEWIFIVIIVVVIFFGAKKIPDLARGFGKATSEFEKARIEAKRELRELKNAGTSSSSTTATNTAANREKLESIADTLGIDYTDKNDEQLRLAIETEINKSQTKA